MTAATPFASTLAAFRPKLLRFARLQLRDAAAAEDAVQDALLAALSGAHQYAGRAEVQGWVFGILKHKIVDTIRQQNRSINASALGADDEALDQTLEALFDAHGHWTLSARPQGWGDPQAALRQHEFWDVFDACLNHLPEHTARVFMMREFLEFETSEVCQQLGITANHCHVILHRARLALRSCLERGWFAPDIKEDTPC
ncbi:RNA polymerase subunit sigma [Hylemonella gracilis]|uniref:RNA polymerase subunit sigma n=1 Tax=Hylemonella gracilis TaxID=80880 RepID=A0A4P6UI18_9BURK|nr:sigma-70 family RNA polymerase sigma factor [Hylemonella gracilis]QBK04712.1 RNA polymerase subunit sigma [Hylemonella gracilis]